MLICLFLLNPKHYQNEIWSNGQILVCCMTNISNILTQCWRLETSSRPFYDFITMTIYDDPAILKCWLLSFSIFPYSGFQKRETQESWHNWLLSNCSRLLNWKGPETSSQSSKLLRRLFSTNCSPCLHLLAGHVWWLNELWFKRYIQKCTVSCTNTHHDITNLANHGMVKTTKNLNILRTKHNFSAKYKSS